MGPQRTYMHVYTHIHTGLAHACTRMCPLCPVTLTQALRGYINSHTCPHGNGKGQKQAGWSRAGERAASPTPGQRGGRQVSPHPPRPQWWKLTQVSSLLIPKTPPGGGVKIHRQSQENDCPMWGRCLLCARHRANWRALTYCLPLPHIDLLEGNHEPHFQVRKLRLGELNNLLTQGHWARKC